MGKQRPRKALITMKPKKKVRQEFGGAFHQVSKKKRMLNKKSSDDMSDFNRRSSAFRKPAEKKTRTLARKFSNKLFDPMSFHESDRKKGAIRNKRTLGKRPANSTFDYAGLKASKRKKLEKGKTHKVVALDGREPYSSRASRRHNQKPAVIESYNRNRSKWASSANAGTSSLSLPSVISTKGKKNPLKDLEVKWVSKTITSYRHTDYQYGCNIIAKANKQVLGGTAFRRYSNSCWELELSTKKEALEVRFGDDFLVFKVDVKTPQKRTLEIGFMHWSQKVRITMNTGREDLDDYFPIDLRKNRFEVKKSNVSTLKLISKFNEAFVSEALKRLTPIKNAVHQAVIEEYKKFTQTLKPFISVAALVRTIWCFAATPAQLGTRAMCELRDRFCGAFRPDGFNIVTLAPALRKFRKRALEDLVQGDEACSWVAKACQRVGDFERVLATEAKLRK